MIYDSTEKNIISLLQSVGSLERAQLIRFFSDAMPAVKVEGLLRTLTAYSFLRYDGNLDRFSYHNATDMTEELEKRKIRAFWIAAQCGSREVLQIYSTEYPTQLTFINPKNIVFDVTVCYSENEGLLAKQIRDRQSVKGVPDATNHIAVVTDPNLGARLGRYGFDCFCTLDPKTHVPHYAQCV